MSASDSHQSKLQQIEARWSEIIDAATAEGRDLTKAERVEIKALRHEFTGIDEVTETEIIDA